MPALRLFGPAREAAGTGRAILPGRSVAELLDAAQTRFGPDFAMIVAASNVWVNGEPAEIADGLFDGDEVAVLPPVSGG